MTLTAFSTTCQLVRIVPFAPTTMPEPVAVPCCCWLVAAEEAEWRFALLDDRGGHEDHSGRVAHVDVVRRQRRGFPRRQLDGASGADDWMVTVLEELLPRSPAIASTATTSAGAEERGYEGDGKHAFHDD